MDKKSKKGSILIIDDTPNNLDLLYTILSAEGYQVRLVMEGELALRSVHAAQPDLILLDIIMPDMDGFEVCRRLKADDKTKDIPIIFLSAIDEVFDKVNAFSLGGVDYITKPFAVKEVLARIDTHVKLTHLQRELQFKTKQLQQEINERKNLQEELVYYKNLTENIMDKLPEGIDISYNNESNH